MESEFRTLAMTFMSCVSPPSLRNQTFCIHHLNKLLCIASDSVDLSSFLNKFIVSLCESSICFFFNVPKKVKMIELLLITRGETCGELVKKSFFKRLFHKNTNGNLLESSKQHIEDEKAVGLISDTLAPVEQVVTHFDEASIETARLFFPGKQVDTIRFKTLEKFKKKIAELSYSDAPIAVFVPLDKFKLITGIENHNYFAIYSEKYMKTASSNSLEHVSDHSVFIGREKYDTVKDETSCKLSKKINMKEIDGEYCCWLSKLPDSTMLRNLRVPQAHDTATGMMKSDDPSTWKLKDLKFLPKFLQKKANNFHVFKWTQTQDMNVKELLFAGIRSLDLRIWVPKTGRPIFSTTARFGSLLISSRFWNRSLGFSLKIQTSSLYVLFIFSGPGNIPKVWKEVKEVVGDQKLFVTHNAKDLSLVDVRGKLLAYSNDVLPEVPTMLSYYKTFSGPNCTGKMDFIAKNWEELQTMYIPCFPRPGDENNIFVTQLHTQVDLGAIKKNKGSGGIKAATRRFNSRLIRWLKKNKKHKVMNIIEFDYWRPSFMSVFQIV